MMSSINLWSFFAILFSAVSFFPLMKSSHWLFRIFDFVRLQLLVILVITLIIGLTSFPLVETTAWVFHFALLGAITYQVRIILPYIPKAKDQRNKIKGITILSVNVMQENTNYEKLMRLVDSIDPDIVLTMETNADWELALSDLENRYKNVVKIPKENRYGMHFYSNIDLKESKVHHLISEEHPSIEAHLCDSDENEFTFWGIHPPPPSPTEKPTARQKDAELMKVAELVRKSTLPLVVCGDFNNVCWSRSSKQFGRISRLKDARINKGVYATFPARFWPFRIPIDLFFHSKGVEILRLKVLSPIGSDHLPFLSEFRIVKPQKPNPSLKSDQKEMIREKVNEGKEAAKEENGN